MVTYKNILATAAAAALAFWAVQGVWAGDDPQKAAEGHQCGSEKCPGAAPDFVLKDLDGKDVKLSDFVGKKIVVLEWANWDCPFVKPHYQNKTFAKLIDKYVNAKEGEPEKKVVWLTINSTHYAKPEDHKAWAKEHQLKHPILADPTGHVGRLYKATHTPHMYIIDLKGHIAYQGAIDNAPLGKVPDNEKYVNYVEQALDALLAGKEPPVKETKAYGCTVKYPPQQ
ncbi:MAG: redoxin domain-containing protein [Anaerohalosphaeraceae bacterium]